MSDNSRAYGPASQAMLKWMDYTHLQQHLIWAYETRVSTAVNGRVEAKDMNAWLIESGEAEVRMVNEPECVRAQAGQWLFPKPGLRYQQFAKDTRLLSVCFRLGWPSGLNLFDDGLTLSIEAEAFPELTQSARTLVKAVRTTFEATYPNGRFPRLGPTLDITSICLSDYVRWNHAFSHWVSTFIATMLRNQIEPCGLQVIDSRVMQALAWINRAADDGFYSEQNLAKSVGLSASHLARLFTQTLGKTPHEYFNQERLRRINHALDHSDEPVKSIAYRNGFKNPAHFSRWYKEQTGLSPRSYRMNQSNVSHV
jgi:AraC-like DNA-binding protein